jgi:hypothetical protein
MANDKSFKIKNGLSATRYLGTNGTKTAGSNGPYGTFDTTLYTTDGASSKTINTGMDITTDGGLVWLKRRSGSYSHSLYDTVRGATKQLQSDAATAESTESGGLTAFTSSGFTIGSTQNQSALGNMVAWTFKQASNFFDVVTFTGNGSSGRTVSHNLGSVPGCIIIKRTSSVEDWVVYHRGADATSPEDYYFKLNTTAARIDSTAAFNDTAPTSTEFTLGNNGDVNASSETYVAYLFAHDTSDDGYIQCGTTTGNGDSVNLGWKPSWLMIKRTDSTGNWVILDNQRVTGTTEHYLYANTSDAEQTSFDLVTLTDTGFDVDTGFPTGSYIYIAIRALVQTQTLDLSTGHTFSITPTEATDVLFSNPPASGTATGFSVEIDNSAGGYAITWPSSVKWHENTAPTATASKEVYTFITTDGGTTYYGKKAGENLA